MPIYIWKGRTRQGTVKKGEMEAASDAAVMTGAVAPPFSAASASVPGRETTGRPCGMSVMTFPSWPITS